MLKDRRNVNKSPRYPRQQNLPTSDQLREIYQRAVKSSGAPIELPFGEQYVLAATRKSGAGTCEWTLYRQEDGAIVPEWQYESSDPRWVNMQIMSSFPNWNPVRNYTKGGSANDGWLPPPEPADEDNYALMEGQVENVPLPMVFHSIERDAFTGRLEVHSNNRVVKVYINEGRPTHCTLGKREGMEAFSALVAFTNGTFYFYAGARCERKTLPRDLELLLQSTFGADSESDDESMDTNSVASRIKNPLYKEGGGPALLVPDERHEPMHPTNETDGMTQSASAERAQPSPSKTPTGENEPYRQPTGEVRARATNSTTDQQAVPRKTDPRNLHWPKMSKPGEEGSTKPTAPDDPQEEDPFDVLEAEFNPPQVSESNQNDAKKKQNPFGNLSQQIGRSKPPVETGTQVEAVRSGDSVQAVTTPPPSRSPFQAHLMNANAQQRQSGESWQQNAPRYDATQSSAGELQPPRASAPSITETVHNAPVPVQPQQQQQPPMQSQTAPPRASAWGPPPGYEFPPKADAANSAPPQAQTPPAPSQPEEPAAPPPVLRTNPFAQMPQDNAARRGQFAAPPVTPSQSQEFTAPPPQEPVSQAVPAATSQELPAQTVHQPMYAGEPHRNAVEPLFKSSPAATPEAAPNSSVPFADQAPGTPPNSSDPFAGQAPHASPNSSIPTTGQGPEASPDSSTPFGNPAPAAPRASHTGIAGLSSFFPTPAPAGYTPLPPATNSGDNNSATSVTDSSSPFSPFTQSEPAATAGEQSLDTAGFSETGEPSPLFSKEPDQTIPPDMQAPSEEEISEFGGDTFAPDTVAGNPPEISAVSLDDLVVTQYDHETARAEMPKPLPPTQESTLTEPIPMPSFAPEAAESLPTKPVVDSRLPEPIALPRISPDRAQKAISIKDDIEAIEAAAKAPTQEPPGASVSAQESESMSSAAPAAEPSTEATGVSITDETVDVHVIEEPMNAQSTPHENASAETSAQQIGEETHAEIAASETNIAEETHAEIAASESTIGQETQAEIAASESTIAEETKVKPAAATTTEETQAQIESPHQTHDSLPDDEVPTGSNEAPTEFAPQAIEMPADDEFATQMLDDPIAPAPPEDAINAAAAAIEEAVIAAASAVEESAQADASAMEEEIVSAESAPSTEELTPDAPPSIEEPVKIPTLDKSRKTRWTEGESNPARYPDVPGYSKTDRYEFRKTFVNQETQLIAYPALMYFTEMEIVRCARYNKAFSIILIQVGTQTDDHSPVEPLSLDSLALLGSMMIDIKRAPDILGHFDPHGLAILLPETERRTADRLAKRVASLITDIKPEMWTKGKSLRFRIGIAGAPDNGTNLNQIVAEAMKYQLK